MTRRELFKKLVLTPIAVGFGTVAATHTVKLIHDKYLVDNTWVMVYNGKRPIEARDSLIWRAGEGKFEVV